MGGSGGGDGGGGGGDGVWRRAEGTGGRPGDSSSLQEEGKDTE